MAAAQVLFHRFYFKKSFVRFSAKKYSELRHDLIGTERHLLKEMGFICHVEHPHKFISNYLVTLEAPELTQEAWDLANDRAPEAHMSKIRWRLYVFMDGYFWANYLMEIPADDAHLEARIISRLSHRHLVQLVGWCHGGGGDLLLVVYELMPNGSLDKHLYSADSKLPWHKIVLEIASAILYLHQEWEQCVLHRDIKPSNVMLDASFHAKLGDFGLARLVDHARGSHTTVLAGTLGYMDPGCRVRGRVSAQSDVYSFGVVLLEVACGRGPAVVLDDDAVIHLSRHVAELHGRGRVLDAADPRLGREFDAREMESVLVAGLWCTQEDRNTRPSISQVIGVLRFELPLPSLPERAPVVVYKPPAGLLMNSDPSSHGTNSTSGMSTSI
ncbi:hypothetical protein C2845_PM12G18990 [Panicum miliaceum]|uniref:Protein kinase domain-containing protein n=1 Tax=Panicum miliaceum TaxID=4540 RepID=A0A3L6QGP9_PANMI|nr:hypothetical protein C2845_PM12G18990 [Panicum miliaceum]